MGANEATFYVWEKKRAQLGVAELRQFRIRVLTQCERKQAPTALERDHSIGE
jgi:hypothetical protein